MINKLKKIIVILCFIIAIIVLILLFYLKMNENYDSNITNNIDEKSFDVEVDEEIMDTLTEDELFNAKNCIQLYVNYIADKNYDAVMSVLDENYIKENNISVDNIENKIKKYNDNNYCIISKAYKKELTLDIVKYYISGSIFDNKFSTSEQIDCTVLMDNANNVFSIVPEDLRNNSKFEFNEHIKLDANNYYNKVVYKAYSNGDVISEYFNLYKDLAINNPNLAFQLLDSTYKEKRFNNSIDEYKKYLKDIDVENIYLSKFSYNIYKNYNEYVGVDKNGLYYFFREKTPMNFSVILDTYTILSDDFKETYDKADNEKKIQMNIDRFVHMINNKDYRTAYGYIADGFKNNYLDTQDKFENYIKNEFFEYNNFEFDSIEQKGSYLYTCTLTLTDATGNSKDSKKITIIMQLNDNYDFKMSFSV